MLYGRSFAKCTNSLNIEFNLEQAETTHVVVYVNCTMVGQMNNQA